MATLAKKKKREREKTFYSCILSYLFFFLCASLLCLHICMYMCAYTDAQTHTHTHTHAHTNTYAPLLEPHDTFLFREAIEKTL